MHKPKAIRRGLVLPGGGALGAYQAGALSAIKEHGIDFEVIAATSIGIVNALAWNRGEMVYALEAHWREHVKRFAPFDPKRLLILKNPFRFRESLDHLFDRYRDDHPAPDKEGQVKIIVSLTEVSTGRSVSFSTADPSMTRIERELIYKASTVIPALGDKPIEIRGRRYYDGAFSNNMPIESISGKGLDEIWIISLLPQESGAVWRRLFEKVTAKKIWQDPQNPWLLGAFGLIEQLIRPKDLSGFPEKFVAIRPDPIEASKHFRVLDALIFSQHKIEKLFSKGRHDGKAACLRYIKK